MFWCGMSRDIDGWTEDVGAHYVHQIKVSQVKAMSPSEPQVKAWSQPQVKVRSFSEHQVNARSRCEFEVKAEDE